MLTLPGTGLNAIRTWQALRKEARFPEAELERIQWTRFLAVFRQAYDASPFYRRRFDDAGVAPDRIRTRNDLPKIPVLTRGDLRDGQRLIARGYGSQKLFRSCSSGVTGERAETFFDTEAWLLGKFLLKLRARLACGVRPWHRIALFHGGEFRNSTFRRLCLRQSSYSVHDPVEAVLPAVARYSPHILYGPPGYFRQHGETLAERIAPKMVFTSGETLTGATRRWIEACFRAPVYDVYGCTEVKEIAWECPERSGYHVNVDRVLVEGTEPVGGAEGPDRQIIVTSLYNYAMPLIRYRVGDTGRFLATKCPCGRTLPLMSPAFCRTVDFLTLPAGGVVSPYTVIKTMETVPGFGRFQIVQDGDLRVVVRVVPDRGSNDGDAGPPIRDVLSPLFPGVRIDVVKTNTILPDESGKYRIVISNVERPE